jgi:hypothetical protein
VRDPDTTPEGQRVAQAKVNNTPINESFAIQDIFATELAALENLGPCYRLTFAVTQAGYDGSTERVAVSKVIIPAHALHQMLIEVPVMLRTLPERPKSENPTHLN